MHQNTEVTIGISTFSSGKVNNAYVRFDHFLVTRAVVEYACRSIIPKVMAIYYYKISYKLLIFHLHACNSIRESTCEVEFLEYR